MRTIRVTSLKDERPGAATRAQHVMDWMNALGVDHRTVRADQDIHVSDTAVTFDAFTLDSAGRRIYSGNEIAIHSASVALTADPTDFNL